MMKTLEVVAAVIYSNNKIFATQRGYGEFKGWWEFPGGKIEAGESPEEALVREIQEELDTTIKVETLIDIVEYDYDNFHLHMKVFSGKILSGNLVLKEHQSARWLLPEELDCVNWLPADLSIIAKIKNNLEYSFFT